MTVAMMMTAVRPHAKSTRSATSSHCDGVARHVEARLLGPHVKRHAVGDGAFGQIGERVVAAGIVLHGGDCELKEREDEQDDEAAQKGAHLGDAVLAADQRNPPARPQSGMRTKRHAF